MTIDEALDRFAIVDGVDDLAAIDMFRGFAEDFGPGYLSSDAEQAYEQAMMGGAERPFASTGAVSAPVMASPPMSTMVVMATM